MIWLRVLLFIPLVVAARIRQVEQRAIMRLQNAGANTAERAILMERAGPVAVFVHRRLERAGVLQAAANDRYYLNETAYRTFQARQRRRAMAVIVSLIVVLSVWYFGGYFSCRVV